MQNSPLVGNSSPVENPYIKPFMIFHKALQYDTLNLSFSVSSPERVVAIHCLAALDLGGGVEQPFDCLIVLNRQAVQSMGRSMDWTLEDNMVDGLFFCTTLTSRRGGHIPFVEA